MDTATSHHAPGSDGGAPTLNPDHYWACDMPERPYDNDLIHFGHNCYECWLVAFSAVKAGHGREMRVDRWVGPRTLGDCVIDLGIDNRHFERVGVDPFSLGDDPAQSGYSGDFMQTYGKQQPWKLARWYEEP